MRRSASSPTSSASGTAGRRRRARRRPAAPAAAGSTGRPASAAAPGSASTRAPISARSRLTASSGGSTSRSSRAAPSLATRPASASRLVTTTGRPGCRAAAAGPARPIAALSSTISIRRPASRLRYSAARSSALGRDLLAGHAERAQEPGQRVAGGHRLAGVVAAQVHIQLAVGEPAGDLVRPVHGQRGLADPGRAADRRDHHAPAACCRPRVEQAGQRGQLRCPAGEVPHRGRQLPRHSAAAAAPGLPAGPGAAGRCGRPGPGRRRGSAGAARAARRRARRPAPRPASRAGCW